MMLNSWKERKNILPCVHSRYLLYVVDSTLTSIKSFSLNWQNFSKRISVKRYWVTSTPWMWLLGNSQQNAVKIQIIIKCSALNKSTLNSQSMHTFTAPLWVTSVLNEWMGCELIRGRQRWNEQDFLSTLRALSLSLSCWSDDFLVAVRTTASKISSTPSVSEPWPLVTFGTASARCPDTSGLPLSIHTTTFNCTTRFTRPSYRYISNKKSHYLLIYLVTYLHRKQAK